MDNEQNLINNSEDEINLFQLCKVIFHRWKLLSIITAATTLVGTLGITFLYTRNAEKYSLEYHYNIPSMNNENDTLINNTNFSYLDLVSKDVINTTIERSDAYASLDKDNIFKSIEITREDKNEENNANKTAENIVRDYYYTITIPKKYFKNKDIALSFIEDLASYPVKLTNEIVKTLNYKINLQNFTNAASYTEQISYLSNEYYIIESAYNSLIKLYGDQITKDNRQTSYYQNELEMYFKSNSISALQAQVNKYGYVLNPTIERAQLESSIIGYERQIKINDDKIEKITDEINKLNYSSVSVTSDDSLFSTLSNLITENVDLTYSKSSAQNKLLFIDGKLVVDGESITEVPEDFKTLLETYYKQLDSFADIYVEIEQNQVASSSKVIYSTTAIQQDGGINIILSMIISLAVGFIIGAITNICLDHDYLYKPYPEKNN